MDLQTYAAAERGRQNRLAKKIGVSTGYICQIISGFRPIPIELAAQIEIATDGNVTRKEMFPTKWQSIWPELMETTQRNCHD